MLMKNSEKHLLFSRGKIIVKDSKILNGCNFSRSFGDIGNKLIGDSQIVDDFSVLGIDGFKRSEDGIE